MVGETPPSPPIGERARRPRVAVLGGGLTGLATAWHLRADADVTVFEAASSPGGQVRTVTLAGAPIDVGADAFLARQPEAEQLVRALGFGDEELVAPSTGQVWLYRRGRRRALPADTVLGAPTSIRALARTGALSAVGLARAAAEPAVRSRSVAGDRTVADLIASRYGREVVDRLVEPLLGGVYAGDVDRLSAAATLPPVWRAHREARSLTAGLRAHRARTAGDDRPVFLTVRGGLGRVIARLHAELGDRVRTSEAVEELRAADDGWHVRTAAGSARYDQVVLALPAPTAATLLAASAPDLARDLAAIRTASVAVVALAYRPADARRVPAGSGVLVPRVEGRLVKAVTVSSRKWPHQAARTDAFVLRASLGRVDDEVAVTLEEPALLSAVEREVAQLLDLDGAAIERVVQRWPAALPQYDLGHLRRVERLRTEAHDRFPGLHLGGAALDGVGLAARARDAGRLAHEVRWTAANRPVGIPSPAERDAAASP
ncbi:MAG: protoporphyrinogen oxidase [Nitriliruptoraceae bacterium]|nr:protoporphyrinogen oxidase [Nitriliruptoraceae bacterium]